MIWIEWCIGSAVGTALLVFMFGMAAAYGREFRRIRKEKYGDKDDSSGPAPMI